MKVSSVKSLLCDEIDIYQYTCAINKRRESRRIVGIGLNMNELFVLFVDAQPSYNNI